MASLGTVSISGPQEFLTNAPQSFTASITSKGEDAILTWEGVGCDLYGENTGGLTGNDDHNETVSLIFKTAGTYTIKAGWSDVNADNTPQYSENLVLTVSEPDPLTQVTETTLDGLPFVGQILTLNPGTASGGSEPLSTAYSWQRSKDGSWTTLDGFTDTAYSPKETDIGWKIRGVATVSDSVGAKLALPSLETTPVAKEPDPIDPNSGYTGWCQYNIASLVYHYRAWHNRNLEITQVDSQTFTVKPGGRIDDYRAGRSAGTPTEGEVAMVWRWLAFRWSGTLQQCEGGFQLSCSGTGRFAPSGGCNAVVIGEPPAGA